MRHAQRGWITLVPFSLAVALASCATPTRARWAGPPDATGLALGPIPAGYTRLALDWDQVRWRPNSSGLADGLPGPQRSLLGLGFSEVDTIQKLVLRASWLSSGEQPEVVSTEATINFTGSVPSPFDLTVPAGSNRVFELLGQRAVYDGEATTTYNVAHAISLGTAPSGQVLSINFDPDRHAAGRALRSMLDNSVESGGTLRDLVASQDVSASLVALVNAKTGYSSSTNSYQRVNPVAFRSEALVSELAERGLGLLNDFSTLPARFETEGWSKLRVKAKQRASESQQVAQGGDVSVTMYDLNSGGGQKPGLGGQLHLREGSPWQPRPALEKPQRRKMDHRLPQRR